MDTKHIETYRPFTAAELTEQARAMQEYESLMLARQFRREEKPLFTRIGEMQCK